MSKGNRLLISLLCISITLLLSGSSFVQSKGTQETTETSAEISATIIDPSIPGIHRDWTSINLTIFDNFGLPWNLVLEGRYNRTFLGSKFLYSNFWTQTWWVYFWKIPKGMLGYTSLGFQPDSPPTGWSVKVWPATINTTTEVMEHRITVYAQVNRLASNYSPVIKIKCIRYDTFGVEYGISYINLPLKAISFNFIYVQALEPTKKAPPRSIVSFPIEVTNKGEYRNTFQFNVTGELGTYGLVSEQGLTLDPKETRTIQLQVATPEVFYDVGTPRKIDIFVYPSGNPSAKFNLSVIVITEGFYISPLITVPLAIIIILVIIIYFLFFYLRAKRERELYGKPDKPWTIPEERAHLAELKRDDKEAYRKERQMMEDEYTSALLYYKDYRASLKQKPEEKPPEQSVETEKPKEKPKRRLPSFPNILKKSETPPPVPKKEPIVPADEQAKQKALAKIKSEQEKQLKKLNKK
jgi:uncharacterized membrane protein